MNRSANGQQENYVVGIGASAGGLDAINELFDNMPGNTGYSFIVIQHLSPDYKSLMSELLAKHTPMKVYEATENTNIEPNCIYLLPAKKLMTIEGGKLILQDKQKDHLPNTAIDTFFQSLARDKGEQAIGIVLSGTGTDGTRGIEAIRKAGGIVIVQDPASAEFDGMPNSAIAGGHADMILSPDMMAQELLEFVKEAPLLKAFHILNNQEEAIVKDILELVHNVTGHDFSFYKRPTINRRLLKRMLERGIKNLSDYYHLLQENEQEVNILSRQFLINVTRFFRDQEAFELLKSKLLPSLFADKVPGDTVKGWVVACSTGEEAYSIAILFCEYMEAHKLADVTVKIFATDIDQQVIETASKGYYPDAIEKEISKERLKKYFVREGQGYRVSPSLRKMVVFARHDVLKDPPFSKLDFLSCRNLLIYMNPVLQKSILRKFHFALNEHSYLFLGPSENINVLKDSMHEMDRKWKIYKCISKEKLPGTEVFVNPGDKDGLPQSHVPVKTKNALNSISEIFKETLLEEYNFAGVFIDRDFDVKQATGNFRNFLRFPEENFNFNLLKLVPTDLSIALSTSVRKAIQTNEKVVLKRVRVNDGKSNRYISIVVKPYLLQKTYLQPFLFIVLKDEEIELKAVSVYETSSLEGYAKARFEDLEAELRDTRENLQAVIEEVESANEELQSSNEEIISSNEELQSTNEELQSLNEELHTVNTEHQLKIKELIELNDDLNNYFNNTEIGQLIIDRRLVVRKFTPAVTKQINLIGSDIGRSITDISTNFKGVDFVDDIKDVIRSGALVEKEVRMETDRICLMQITPYIKQDGQRDGVVVNFVDISELRRLNSMLEAIFNSSGDAIIAQRIIRDKHGKPVDFEIIQANETVENLFGVLPDKLTGKRISDFLPELMLTHREEFVRAAMSTNKVEFEYYDVEKGQWLEVTIARMLDGIVANFSDITQKKKALDLLEQNFETLKTTSSQLEKTNFKLQQSNLDLLQFASVASHDLKEPLRKVQAFGNMLMEKVRGKLDEKESNYLEIMIRSSNRMQTLIEDILLLSKLSNNDVERRPVDLNETVKNIIDDLEVTIKEKNAKIEFEQLPTIQAVPGQMHQLFLNLISNALKFNENGHPHVKLFHCDVDAGQLHSGDKADEFICLRVQDNGIGFRPEYKEKIFGIFKRLEGMKYQGAGIGLAICKRIVDNHHGYIAADGKPGEGAVFTVMLPHQAK